MCDRYAIAVLRLAAAVLLWFIVRPAFADGPQHGALTCDPVCVVRYCEVRCLRLSPAEGAECREECERYVTASGCWPCVNP